MVKLHRGAISHWIYCRREGITLAISESGDAYVLDIVSDKIFKINLTNATTIGPGVPLTDGINPISINFAQDADFDCGANGTLRGILVSGASSALLGTINPATGVFTQTASLGQEICAFSVDCENMVVPTMGEWALLILALSLMSMGTVFILRKRLVLAGETAAHYRQPATLPFHKATFTKALVLIVATMVTLFAVAISGFGYEMTSADLPGALIASPIAAYLLHLLVGFKE